MKGRKRRTRQVPVPVVIALMLISATCTTTAALGIYWYLYSVPVYDVIEFPMEVYVDNILGINAETDRVHFGIVPPGNSASREMTVTAGDSRSVVTFEITGDIGEWVTVSENDIRLNPWENRTVSINVQVPKDVKPLAYRSGALRIVFRKA